MKKYRLVEILQGRKTVVRQTDDLRDAGYAAGEGNPNAEYVIERWDGIAYQPIEGVVPAAMTF
jgi:hypothetical protein